MERLCRITVIVKGTWLAMGEYRNGYYIEYASVRSNRGRSEAI